MGDPGELIKTRQKTMSSLMQRNVSRPPDLWTGLCSRWEQFARHASLRSCQLVTWGVAPSSNLLTVTL